MPWAPPTRPDCSDFTFRSTVMLYVLWVRTSYSWNNDESAVGRNTKEIERERERGWDGSERVRENQSVKLKCSIGKNKTSPRDRERERERERGWDGSERVGDLK